MRINIYIFKERNVVILINKNIVFGSKLEK